MTYSSHDSTPSACDHQERAWAMALNTAASSVRGRNLSTLYAACCTPSDCCTDSRKAPRRFFGTVCKCACTKARSKISSAEGSGNSGTGSVLGTPHFRAPKLNGIVTKSGKRAPNNLRHSVTPPHVSVGVGG